MSARRVALIVADDQGMTLTHTRHPLPVVTVNKRGTRITDDGAAVAARPGHSATSYADHHLTRALAHLALWVDLTENPPVDPAQVDALASVIEAIDNEDADFRERRPTEIARRLIASGKVTIATETA